MNPLLPGKDKVLKVVFYGLLFFLLILNVSWKLVLAGSYAPDLGGFERNVIWGIQRLMSGLPLYSHPDSVPFAMVQYMPLYYYLVSGLARLAGMAPGDAHLVYSLARGINLLLSILLSAGIFLVLKRQFRIGALLAVGFSALGFLLLDSFTISGRPDMLKSFFFLAQVLFLTFQNGIRLRFQMAAGLIFSLLCFLCKQDGLLAFGIFPLAFLLGREWKNLFFYSFSAAALLSGSLVFFQWQSGGAFLPNVFGALQNGISISWFMSVFAGFFARHALLFGPALVLSFEFSREKNRKLRLLASAFLLAFIPPLFASLKFGSGPNYFQEALLISCILLPVGLSASPSLSFFRFKESNYLLASSLILLLIGLQALNWATGVFLHQESRLKVAYEKDCLAASEIRQEFPGKKIMLLTDCQWEDNLTCLLSDRLLNPNRDVSAQVYTGKKGDALHALKDYVEKSEDLILLTGKGQNPGFPGMDFSGFQAAGSIIGDYQVWKK